MPDRSQFRVPCSGTRNAKPETRNAPRSSKGQVSTELLVIVGFVVLLFIPLVLFVYYKTGELNGGIEGLEGRLLSSKLAFISNSLGSMGDGNYMKVEFSLPERVHTLEFRSVGQGGEVLMTMDDGSQVSQVTRLPFNSTRMYAGGLSYKLEFRSEGGLVQVSQSS